MRITEIKMLIVNAPMRNWIFVKAETNPPGLYGCGEAMLEEKMCAVVRRVEDFKPTLAGRNPTRGSILAVRKLPSTAPLSKATLTPSRKCSVIRMSQGGCRWGEPTNRWCRGTELNRRRQPFQGCALPPELPRHGFSLSNGFDFLSRKRPAGGWNDGCR
jgi:hypothetical protein